MLRKSEISLGGMGRFGPMQAIFNTELYLTNSMSVYLPSHSVFVFAISSVR